MMAELRALEAQWGFGLRAPLATKARLRSRGALLAPLPSYHPIAGWLIAGCSPFSTAGATARKMTLWHGARCCGGILLWWETHFYSGGPEGHMSLCGKQRRAVGNSHRPGGSALERGGDALAKLKNMTGRQDVPRHCARRLGGPDRGPFSVRE
jgi:hypothetical protein